jgi:hypothetical protein
MTGHEAEIAQKSDIGLEAAAATFALTLAAFATFSFATGGRSFAFTLAFPGRSGFAFTLSSGGGAFAFSLAFGRSGSFALSLGSMVDGSFTLALGVMGATLAFGAVCLAFTLDWGRAFTLGLGLSQHLMLHAAVGRCGVFQRDRCGGGRQRQRHGDGAERERAAGLYRAWSSLSHGLSPQDGFIWFCTYRNRRCRTTKI